MFSSPVFIERNGLFLGYRKSIGYGLLLAKSTDPASAGCTGGVCVWGFLNGGASGYYCAGSLTRVYSCCSSSQESGSYSTAPIGRTNVLLRSVASPQLKPCGLSGRASNR